MNATLFLACLWSFAFGVWAAGEAFMWMAKRHRATVADTHDTDPRGGA